MGEQDGRGAGIPAARAARRRISRPALRQPAPIRGNGR